MDLWHDIESGTDEEMNVIIETPKGSHNKYEIDKATGMIKLDRANYGAAAYPFDYGYVPQTLWEDGDALDVMLISSYPVFPGILVHARPVGIMDMTDSGDPDSKIIAVPVHDQRFDDIQDLEGLSKHSLKEFANFFENLKALKKKPGVVTVHGFKGVKEAKEAFAHGQKLYKEKFAK